MSSINTAGISLANHLGNRAARLVASERVDMIMKDFCRLYWFSVLGEHLIPDTHQEQLSAEGTILVIVSACRYLWID